ncbi:restriction endonuclease subunit S [Enterococcus hirae]|uniref:restriction endonuclease subunit S n=1 Tax=Enterococcus hirae TaxID=1354 RepID=UPI001A96E142|nr:restriction endonuclease subunit S [Enterococcus hirae]MBO1117571.1 restriction endonuclease subunit S [Enterococcus hirae]
MSKDKQPEIRFPGFTDEWEQRKLGEVVESVGTGRSTFTNGIVQTSETPYAVLGSTSVISYDSMFDHSGDFILTARVGANAGNLYKYFGEVKISDNTVYIQANNLDFIYYLLTKYDLKRLSFGTGQPLVKASEVKNLKLNFPQKNEEQQKIGSFFKQLDDTIALHQRKLDLLKETKKGFLQKMFPKNGAKVPEIRFPGFTEDWEQRKLGDLTTWTKGQGLTKEDLNKERDGSEAVHYADLYKFSPVMHEVIHWTNSDDGRIIPDNSLLFPASDVTPVGLARTSTLRLSGVKAGGDVIIGQLNESINSSFMSYQINANSKKILPLITGTTVKHIQAKSLATVSVSITNMAEQTAIAGIFEQLDDTITLHQRKLDLLKETKKGFLQKMFV